MTSSNRSSPTLSPGLTAVLSLLVPGLGQMVSGQPQRGLSFLLSVGITIALVWWQALTGLYSFVGFVWVWSVWDAYNLARGRRLSLIPPILAILAIVYTVGWQVTEIDPRSLVRQANRAVPIISGLLSPDFIERQTESRRERAPFEVHCSSSPPPLKTNFADGATVTLSATCGEIGDSLTVQGLGFWPNVETELWWANPIGQEQRLTSAGQPIIVTTGDGGDFQADITVPQAVPLSADTGEPQSHNVQINQQRIIGGWQISENGWLVLEKMAETVAIALVATTFAIIFAVPLGFIAARNLMSGSRFTMAIYYVTRTLLNIVRSIESLIIAIVFVVWVGLGPFAGVLALTVHSIAALGKLYSEQVEDIDFGPIEAVRATGANRFQMVVYAVLPQVVPPFLSFTLYRWDINVRMSTILGFVGGGGIGFLIVQWQRLSEWSAIGAAFWSIMLIVALLDFVSAKARERLV